MTREEVELAFRQKQEANATGGHAGNIERGSYREHAAQFPETQHTPGSWHTSQGNGAEADRIYVLADSDNPTTPFTSVAWVFNQHEANARLIAAAPDLLAALLLCQVRVFMAEGSENEAYRAAIAAVTAARGTDASA